MVKKRGKMCSPSHNFCLLSFYCHAFYVIQSATWIILIAQCTCICSHIYETLYIVHRARLNRCALQFRTDYVIWYQTDCITDDCSVPNLHQHVLYRSSIVNVWTIGMPTHGLHWNRIALECARCESRLNCSNENHSDRWSGTVSNTKTRPATVVHIHRQIGKFHEFTIYWNLCSN